MDAAAPTRSGARTGHGMLVAVNHQDAAPVDPPSIDAERAQRRIDAYIDAWNEPGSNRREQILVEAMTDDAEFDTAGKIRRVYGYFRPLA